MKTKIFSLIFLFSYLNGTYAEEKIAFTKSFNSSPNFDQDMTPSTWDLFITGKYYYSLHRTFQGERELKIGEVQTDEPTCTLVHPGLSAFPFDIDVDSIYKVDLETETYLATRPDQTGNPTQAHQLIYPLNSDSYRVTPWSLRLLVTFSQRKSPPNDDAGKLDLLLSACSGILQSAN